MRRAGVAVDVSLGGAGTSRWGEVGVGDLVTCAEVEREGAGVRGGGGEQVTGEVTEDGEGLSRSRGFGVRRGGEGVTEGGAGTEAEEGGGSGGEGCVPLVDSLGSGCLGWSPASRSMLQQVKGLRKRGLVLQVSPAARHHKRAACLVRVSRCSLDVSGFSAAQGSTTGSATAAAAARSQYV